MARLLRNPTNPTCGDNNKTKDLGKTRTNSNGLLQYLNPMTGQWEVAVRLEDVRDKILRQKSPSQYTFAKAHGNKHGRGPLNFTSLLLKDKDVGPERQNRPDILFQIWHTGQHTQKPTGYVLDEGRIVLDNFDHGLRDFPHLPKVLSSELSGEDIEYYYRQNGEVADYDLTARMPKSYWTGKGGNELRNEPPRSGTINQRAQRFRSRAALISWGNRAGTGTKNDYILALIPDACKAVNSTKEFRDLTQAEIAALNSQNKGKLSKRKRDAKAEAAAKTATKDTPVEDANTLSGAPAPKRARRKAPRGYVNTAIGSSNPLPISPEAAKHHPRRGPIHAQDQQLALDAAPEHFLDTTEAQADWAEQLSVVDGRTEVHVANSGRKRKQTSAGSGNSAADQEHTSSELAGYPRIKVQSTTASSNKRAKRIMQRSSLDLSTHVDTSPSKAYMASKFGSHTLPLVSHDDPISHRLQVETEAGVKRGDYRYIAPHGHFTDFGDQWDVNRALELTRIDMFEHVGQMPPDSMWAEHKTESYASQHIRIQELFNRVWKDSEHAPVLFCLPEWHNGFGNWQTLNLRGQHLEAVMREIWGELDTQVHERQVL